MVGAVRFELTTSCTRNKRASQATLRPDTKEQKLCHQELGKQLEYYPILDLKNGERNVD